MHSSLTVSTLLLKSGATASNVIRRKPIMKAPFILAIVLLALTGISAAKDPLPDAPSAVGASSEGLYVDSTVSSSKHAPATEFTERKTVDLKFSSLALVSTASTFADSYTTLFARENWLAGKTNVCNEEVESAYLYGTHPTVGRAYAVASVKSASALVAAYYLRKHHSKLWGLPLAANSVISLQGVTQNIRNCN
jgi:hypothetical protein